MRLNIFSPYSPTYLPTYPPTAFPSPLNSFSRVFCSQYFLHFFVSGSVPVRIFQYWINESFETLFFFLFFCQIFGLRSRVINVPLNDFRVPAKVKGCTVNTVVTEVATAVIHHPQECLLQRIRLTFLSNSTCNRNSSK